MLNSFRQMLADKDIQYSHTSSYNPTRNSVSERVNTILNQTMRIAKTKRIEYVIE